MKAPVPSREPEGERPMLTLEIVLAYGPLAHEPDGSILLPVAG